MNEEDFNAIMMIANSLQAIAETLERIEKHILNQTKWSAPE